MSSGYRAHLINSLSGFKSANLIGTINKQGQTNLAIFSSVVHLGASPALVGFIMRPDSVERHTLENIMQTKQYTINQVSSTFWQAAHQTSARYLRGQCEFKQTGLSPIFIDGIRPPFVQESRLKYALTLQEIIPIEINDTLLVIGKITDVFCHQESIKNDGYIDIDSLNTVSISGLDSYHVSQRLSRLSYAKADKAQVKISLDGSSETVT
ncbi:flavin reductase family protein [Colwelliaceae bacterium BS250]